MDEADEESFVDALREQAPDLRLVDGDRLPTPEPPGRQTLRDCSDHHVYLWSPSVAPSLPSRDRGGMFDGPKAGVVV